LPVIRQCALRSWRGDPELLDDVTQESVVRILGVIKAGKFRRKNTMGFLATITRNAAISFARWHQKGPPTTTLDHVEPAAIDPAIHRIEEREEARRRLARLSPHERELFEMRFCGGKTLQEVADTTGCSLTSCWKQLDKISRKLNTATGAA